MPNKEELNNIPGKAARFTRLLLWTASQVLFGYSLLTLFRFFGGGSLQSPQPRSLGFFAALSALVLSWMAGQILYFRLGWLNRRIPLLGSTNYPASLAAGRSCRYG
jgi:hypothetical protein